MLQAHERVYFQYRPDETALARILAWQKQALKVNPQSRQIRPDRFHITILHFGILADVYRELQQRAPELKRETYESAVEEFIERANAILPAKASVNPEGFGLFGPQSHVLAIRVSVDEEIKYAHQKILEHLKHCLKACGITYPVPFMQGSPNFRFARELNPHISLLRAARRVPQVQPESSPLAFTVLPIHYK